MSRYRIGVLNGDDIGLEIVPVTVEVLKSAVGLFEDVHIEWIDLPVGYLAYKEYGDSLPETTYRTLFELDGFILGPIGHMAYPDDEKCYPPHFVLRRDFDLVSNIRPSRSLPGVPCLKDNVDLVIVRENNQGFQPDRNMYKGNSECMIDADTAISTRVITRRNSALAARTAFELARQRDGLKKVTVIHKKTVYKLGCGLFLEAAAQVAADYPDIRLEDCVVDTFAMKLLMQPEKYDVIVASNQFGDILSDEAAGLVGGLGMAPGLNLGPHYAMANATHGSAPDIAGRNVANPYAMILSGQLLISWLGHRNGDASLVAAAARVEAAAQQVLQNKAAVTPDLGGSGSTTRMGEEICRIITGS